MERTFLVSGPAGCFVIEADDYIVREGALSFYRRRELRPFLTLAAGRWHCVSRDE